MEMLESGINLRILSEKIRTPLSAIMGTAELISLESLPHHVQKQMDDILMAGDELVTVADELITASQSHEPSVTTHSSINKTIVPLKYCVLLVEDEPIVQKVHCKMLERLGCKVDLASNGQEALNKISHSYQLTFMDLGLPDIDGYAVTTEIRRRENDKVKTPIIVLTGYPLSEVTEKCLVAGADAVFNKPISIEKLKNILESFCK